jgi:hypothetical protein
MSLEKLPRFFNKLQAMIKRQNKLISFLKQHKTRMNKMESLINRNKAFMDTFREQESLAIKEPKLKVLWQGKGN